MIVRPAIVAALNVMDNNKKEIHDILKKQYNGDPYAVTLNMEDIAIICKHIDQVDRIYQMIKFNSCAEMDLVLKELRECSQNIFLKELDDYINIIMEIVNRFRKRLEFIC